MPARDLIAPPLPPLERAGFWRDRVRFVAPLGVFLSSVGLGALSSNWLGEGYASLIFVLGITVIGVMSGLVMALASAVAASITFNYFVAFPHYSLNFARSTDFAPPFAFAFCAIVSGLMAGRLQDRNLHIAENAQRLVGLLEASRDLQRAAGPAEILEALERRVLPGPEIALALFARCGENLTSVGAARPKPGWHELALAALWQQGEVLRQGEAAAYRLTGGDGVVGVLIVECGAGTLLDPGFVLTLAGIVGLALERAQLAASVVDARAAARTEELKTALLSSVSHDMRTPLTSISTAAASLLAFGAEFDEGTSRQLLSGIVSECERLDCLTANLLEMTRLQSGAANMHPAPLPVAEMIHALVARIDGRDGDGRLRFIPTRRELVVHADCALFDLALTNIIGNALLYSPAGSPVILRCWEQGDSCKISVTDRGPGIAQSEQARVFERFYRLQRGPGVPKGTGLGLAIAKGFVEAFKGSIGVVSPVAAGHGTTITITLPLAEAELATKTAA